VILAALDAERETLTFRRQRPHYEQQREDYENAQVRLASV